MPKISPRPPAGGMAGDPDESRLPRPGAQPGEMRNLAPEIVRQRWVYEGWREGHITAEQVGTFLVDFASALNMKMIGEPVVSRAEGKGEGGLALGATLGAAHWETSGVKFMAWDQPDATAFFTVDPYTCRTFDEDEAEDFITQWWHATDHVCGPVLPELG
jgi:hypothetical protein